MWYWLAQPVRDLSFGARTLAKSPRFAILAVSSLAMGIMATTAIFSVLHAVVLDPFPYKDVDRLMSVRVRDPNGRGGRLSYTVDQFVQIAERNTIFESTIASTISDVVWVGNGDPQRLRGNYGPFNTFQVMGVPPLVGRTPTADDARPGATPVVVLGFRFWQRQFGGDSGVIGRPLQLNGQSRTVIGVMPTRFMWRGADVYLPITFERGRLVEGVRSVHLLGRLKPGVTDAQAETDLTPIIADLKRQDPRQFPDKWRVDLLSFKETFPSDIREDLWILFGAVGLLLLISCANVSHLLLMKAAVRQREMAVRAALGAGRARLIRQLLTESLMIAIVGGALGTLLAYAGLQAILALVPPDTIPDESEIALNAPVLLFTIVVSALTCVIFGLAPALHTCTQDLANGLRDAARGLSGGVRRTLLSNGLVIAEVALSLMLLVGASLMIRTYIAVQKVNLGIRVEQLLTMRIPLADQRYPTPDRRIAFFQELLRRVRAVPGVVAAGVNTGVHPMGNMSSPIEVVGSAPQSSPPVMIHQIDTDYTKAFGIELVGGRLLSEIDLNAKQHVALVNQSFARHRVEQGNSVGRIVRIPRLRQPPFSLTDDTFQVVGIVKDTMNFAFGAEISPEVYLPFTVLGMADHVVALTQAGPAGVTRAVMNQVYAIDKDQPVTDVQPLGTILREDVYAGPRFNLALFSVFAALGLVLVIVGIYGVMSNAVAQQAHEIGVRMALGADSATIGRMIITRGLRLLALGIALGLVGSIAATRMLKHAIWNVSPFDPLSFSSVSLVLLLAGLQACVWPARRAARVDPMMALRSE